MAAGRTDVMASTTPATECRRRRGAIRPAPAAADWTRAGLFGRLSGVDRIFTLEQARLLMPDLLAKADDVVAARADLVEIQTALNQGLASPLGGIPEVKALEARLSEILGWFTAEGLDLKGIAPLLLDFPARLNGDDVLLCWLEGERELRWYHKAEHGFAGRRPLPGPAAASSPVHPNDDVNCAQSTNDTFPAVMHIAALRLLVADLLPALARLREAAARKSEEWARVVKIGRTHLQDATPLTVGQEWSGYVGQLDDAADTVRAALPGLRRLAIGGTAVGTGLNAPPGFGEEVAAEISALTGEEFVSAAEQVRGHGVPRRAGPGVGGAAQRGRSAVQVRQRHALARLGPAHRAR